MSSGVRVPSEFAVHTVLEIILDTTHRQRLIYGVNLNVLAERRAALHFKATRHQARAVDAASKIDASDVMRR